jgi:ELWxxDGT repeat protein
VVFFLHNGQTEVWRTDGTDSGTFMLQRLRRYPSAEFACPEFTDVNGRMFYLGRDVRHGHELWTSDGAVAGTTLVADLKPGRKSSYPWIIGRSGERVVFRTGYPPVLWSSDGTAVDTTKLQQSPYAVHLSPIGGDPTLDGSLFFYTAPDATGSVLWKSDGTPLGTVTVKDVPPTDAYVPPMDAAPVATALLFDGDDVQHGLELWTTDGTEAGTILLRDINPGAAASAPDHMVSSGGVVFFSANDGVHGTELWRSDGTAVGTVMIKDVDPGTVASNVAYLCASPSSGTCSSLRAGG